MDMKTHWEEIYTTKDFEETSWYQSRPENSLTIIESLGLSRNATIIDVGGGNSYLVDHLLDIGYKNLSVLDISATALQDAKNRIGENSGKVEWIEVILQSFLPKIVSRSGMIGRLSIFLLQINKWMNTNPILKPH